MSDLSPFFELLRSRVVLSDVVRSHVKLVRRGKVFTGLCPFHKEKTPSFSINDDKGFYHCFGCGTHGDIFDFLMQKQSLPFMEAVEVVAAIAGLDIPKPTGAPAVEKQATDPSIYKTLEAASSWFEQQLRLASAEHVRLYIAQRGLTEQTIKKFRMGYAPERGMKEALEKQGFDVPQQITAGLLVTPEDEQKKPYDRFRRRLMFPIFDSKNRVVAFGGRIIAEGEPKYLNSPETLLFHKGKTLYAHNFSLPAARSGSPYIIAEGYMDVISLHQAGYTSAVAPLGTALTPEQLILLWRNCPEPILCFDGDTAGTRAAERAATRALECLKPGLSLRFCLLPSGEDPDSLIQKGGARSFQDILQKALPLIDMLWQMFLSKQPLSTPEQKAAARHELLHLTHSIVDQDIRHFYRQELQQRLQQKLQSSAPQNFKAQNTFSPSKYPKFKGPFRGIETKPILARGLGQNKIELGQKILLVTLINHPTLVEEVSEQLMSMSISSASLDRLRQAMLTFLAEAETITIDEGIRYLKVNGFSEVLTEILSDKTYSHARFSHPSADRTDALKGWQEVWRMTETQHQLTQEGSQVVRGAENGFDEQDWNRLKQLKATITTQQV